MTPSEKREVDKRIAERFTVNADTACDFASPVLEDFGPVKIKNVSTHGIGILTHFKLDIGLLLAINLVNRNKSYSKTMLVRVAHVTQHVGDIYLVGGAFVTPITYDELRILVM